MSTASINNNDNDSVSSSSLENDLRHYTNRDSVLNEVASNDGTITSLKRYLSVPFSNGDSRSASEAESIAGDHPNTSPSIYITSPASDECGVMFNFCDVELGNSESCGFQDTHECIEEEDSVATIDVTSSTANASTTNGVAFYIGSQASFNFGLSQGTNALIENDIPNSPCCFETRFNNALRETTSSSFIDNYRSIYSQHFGQYLTVPHCTVNVSAVTNTVSTRNNNMDSSADSTSVTPSTPQPPPGSNKLRRSASDDASVTFGVSPYEGLTSRFRYGSPIPARRLPEVRTRRKNYTRYKSESDDNEHVGLLKRDFKARLRRHSGDTQGTASGNIREEPKRARSHSPSPMTLLSVPGNNIIARGDMTCSSSLSMNDVSSAGNPYAHNLGSDGKILRRSCLSLNSEGRKRRGKSPHRVSFKVS